MKKIFMALICLIFQFQTFAADISNESLNSITDIQKRIDEIGFNVLNLNKIQKRVVFLYDEKEKKNFLKTNKTLSKRQVVLYDELYKTFEIDDEIACVLSREIYLALRTYDGVFGGRLDMVETFLGSKKFELAADKIAVDLAVKAGYHPLGLIIFINKAYPEKRSDFISKHNLTSKRLACLFEYIKTKYPQYLEENENNNIYLKNKYYQNFLLTSIENRKQIQQKIKSNSGEWGKYD